MSADAGLICSPSPEYIPQIQQTASMIVDVERIMRPSDNPIPRPVSIDEIDSDTSKVLLGRNYSLSNTYDFDVGWRLSKIGYPGNCNLPRETGRHRDVSLEIRLK